jgi:DNA-binding response OmpR family regulator
LVRHGAELAAMGLISIASLLSASEVYVESKRALIVDDELAVLTGLSKALHTLCMFKGEVRVVVNGRQAINETSDCFYDICFLDIKLPDINGLDVMVDINKRSPLTHVILMSGMYSAKSMKKIAEDAGGFFIEKPFNFYQIKHMMEMAMEGNGDHYFEQSGVKRKRKFRRKQLEQIVSFYVQEANFMEFKGGAIDISYAGIGLETYYTLEIGQILSFGKGLAHKTGIKAWSSSNNNHCRAGIKFI